MVTLLTFDKIANERKSGCVAAGELPLRSLKSIERRLVVKPSGVFVANQVESSKSLAVHVRPSAPLDGTKTRAATPFVRSALVAVWRPVPKDTLARCLG